MPAAARRPGPAPRGLTTGVQAVQRRHRRHHRRQTPPPGPSRGHLGRLLALCVSVLSGKGGVTWEMNLDRFGTQPEFEPLRSSHSLPPTVEFFSLTVNFTS